MTGGSAFGRRLARNSCSDGRPKTLHKILRFDRQTAGRRVQDTNLQDGVGPMTGAAVLIHLDRGALEIGFEHQQTFAREDVDQAPNRPLVLATLAEQGPQSRHQVGIDRSGFHHLEWCPRAKPIR
jgi:hypothetical protein